LTIDREERVHAEFTLRSGGYGPPDGRRIITVEAQRELKE
jgi:hypothetical protein